MGNGKILEMEIISKYNLIVELYWLRTFAIIIKARLKTKKTHAGTKAIAICYQANKTVPKEDACKSFFSDSSWHHRFSYLFTKHSYCNPQSI